MQNSWIFIALAFLVGALVGLGIAALQRRNRRGDTGDIETLREEFEDYRQDVTAHFVQTAELVNNLTQSYKAVYDHLEGGAYRLVGREQLHRELEAVDAEPVMLEYLGPRKPTAEAGDVDAPPAVGDDAGEVESASEKSIHEKSAPERAS